MATPKNPIPPKPVQSKAVPNVVKQQQVAQQAQAAFNARNKAIQRPVNTAPPPDMRRLQTVAPKLATMVGGNRPRPQMPPRPQPQMPPTEMPVYASPGVLQYAGPVTPNMVGVVAKPSSPEELYQQYVASYDPGVDQYGMPYDVPSFDSFNFQREQAQRRDQTLLGQAQGVPSLQGLTSIPQSVEQQQALQQAQLAQVQALPEQERAMFAEQFQRAQQRQAQALLGQAQGVPGGFDSYGFDPALADYLNKQRNMSQLDAGVSYQYDPATQTFTGNTMGGPVTKTLQEMQTLSQQIPSNFAQPYMQGMGAAAASRAAPRSNPMTGLGAFSANPSIAAANPFAALGVTAGAQQVQQNVQPPYNPQMDNFKGSGAPNVPFSQAMGQLFGTMGQPQTQQSPYAPQQASNLMQNTAQVGQNVYGSFVGQQQPQQQQPMQQQATQQQNPAQSMQGSVAPPMQAGFNFFNQGQDQGGAGGGGTTGGGALF